MMAFRSTGLVFLTLFISTQMVFSQNEDRSVDRLGFILSQLEDIDKLHQNGGVKQVLQDVLRNSTSPDEHRRSLEAIETFIQKTAVESDDWGRAQFTKARLMGRLGQIAAAESLIKEGIRKKWKENGFWELNDLYRETGNEKRLVIDEYHRNVSDEYSEEIHYRFGLGRDLSNVFFYLQKYKNKNKDLSAMEEIFPHLQPSTKSPNALAIAHAFCLACDDRYQEAFILLNIIEEPLMSEQEKKFVPLYFAVIAFFEGKDFDQARRYLNRFIDRNADELPMAFQKILEITYFMEHSFSHAHKMSEVTRFLLNSGLLSNAELPDKIGTDKIASVYDMHAQGLMHNGRKDEAKDLFKEIYERHFPNNLASANAAINYAMLEYELNRNVKLSLAILDECDIKGRSLLGNY